MIRFALIFLLSGGLLGAATSGTVDGVTVDTGSHIDGVTGAFSVDGTLLAVASTAVLPDADFAWFAADYSSTIPEYTGGGAGAMSLSGGAVPLLFDNAQGAWVWFPDGVNDYITTPYDASFNITGDNEIQAKVWATDWTPTTQRHIFNRADNAGTSQWVFRMNSSTTGTLYVSQNNGADSRSSSAATGLSDNSTSWIRTRVDVGTNVTFATSTDGTSWTALGTSQTDMGSATTESTYGLTIGAPSTSSSVQWRGGIYRIKWYNGLPGSGPTQVADFNADDFTQPYATGTDSLGHVYTITRPSTGLQATVINRSLIGTDGTNDYLTAAHHADFDFGTGDFTVSWLGRLHGVGSTRVLFSCKSGTGTGQGWIMLISGTSLSGNMSDGADNITSGSSTITPGNDTLYSLIRSGNTMYVAIDSTLDAGTSVAAVGSVTTTNALNIFASSAPDKYAEGFFAGIAGFNSALSAGDLTTLKAEMTAANQ